MSFKSSDSINQSECVTSEISYPIEFEPTEVDDIIDRLHIGTLRRDQLKARRSVLEAAADEDTPVNDRDLEEFYKGDEAEQKSLTRQSSRASGSSRNSAASGSIASGSSDEQRESRHSKSTSATQTSSDKEIQTTLGRNHKTLTIHDSEETRQLKAQERKSSRKEKFKNLFKRKPEDLTPGKEHRAAPDALIELPQTFLVKYMGRRPTKGLWGSKHTRNQIEAIVDSISQMPKGEDLPLVLLQVNTQGLAMKPHKRNKVKSFRPVAIPIQYISYGLQDLVYPRIFCFIMVKEMSSQSKKLECHVYACDSPKSAHRIATALAVAFQIYNDTLNDGAIKFSVNVPVRQADDDDDDDTKSSYDV